MAKSLLSAPENGPFASNGVGLDGFCGAQTWRVDAKPYAWADYPV